MKKIFLYIFIFILCIPSFGQGKVSITTGAGLPELINIGVILQLSGPDQIYLTYNFGSGFCQELTNKYGEFTFTISNGAYLYFGNTPMLSKIKPWFYRNTIDLLLQVTETGSAQYYWYDIRLGRDINFSKRIGIEFSLGVLIPIDRTFKGEVYWIAPKWSPSFEIKSYIRLGKKS